MPVSLSKSIAVTCLCALLCAPLAAATGCGDVGTWLQVLGSGGPELTDGRASTGYLVWHNGRARVLVDAGTGTMRGFEQSGAAVEDLNMILLSHLHVDHSNDLPALIKASFFTDRTLNLPVYGPAGNELMPATTEYVEALFGPRGAYRYLRGYLSGAERYRVVPHDVAATGFEQRVVLEGEAYRIVASPVHHGPVPALAWRVELAGTSIVFSGDMNNDNNTLAKLAQGADLLVAHHAVPESATGAARNLHMPPSVIGKIAAAARVKRVVLSHRMKRTLANPAPALAEIRRQYEGPLDFAHDLQCFEL